MAPPIYRKILVGFDGSQNSLEACDYSLILAKSLGSKVVVAHVLPLITTYTAPLRAEYEPSLKNSANLEAMKIVTKFQQAKIDCSSEILSAKGSSTADTIIDYSASEGVDMIVVGTRGLGAFQRLILGSVSTNLLNHAKCPVLIVRKKDQTKELQLRKILVATDGSQAATDSVKGAIEIAKATGSNLTIANVVYMAPLPFSEGPPLNIDRAYQDMREEGERNVAAAAKQAKESGVDAKTLVVDNNRSPVWALTDYAEEGEFDLIALGTRGMGGLRRTVLGSVANGVAHYAKCSVLVTR